MQATETESSSSGSKQNIYESIKFRPSPNFKHMKKYLKSKFENDEVEKKNKVNAVVQPPLPPNSPPPDSPIMLKQEVEDDGYERPAAGYSPGADVAAGYSPGADAVAAPAPPDTGAGAPPDTNKKFIMCKDWVRGTCTRGAACIYVHELDKSQLKGVYRFCRDFENARCERTVCNFVHATTFEKEHFFRTANLPAHALYHLQNSAAAPAATAAAAAAAAAAAPVAPARPSAPEVAVPPEMPMFANAPPPALAGAALPSCGAAGVGGVAGAGVLKFTAAPPLSLRREWRDQDDYSSSPRDAEPDPPAKKCKNCEFTTIRLQHSKAAVAGALRSSQELDDKLEQVIKKNDRLQAVLKTLLKPRRVLEHMSNNFLGPRLALGDEGNKDSLLSQMKVLLTKVLLGSEAEARDGGRDLAT